MSINDPKTTPIAVVGVSAIFPGSVDATGFWHDILAGKDLIRDVPESHWLKEDYYNPDPSAPDKTYAVRGAFLDKVPFDPLEWGVPPSIVPATDTTQLLALIVAKQVLEDASRGRWPNIDRERISCILGVTSAQELLGTMVNRLQRPVWSKAVRELGYTEVEVEEICKRIEASYVPWQESSFPGLLGNVVAGRIANRLDIGGTNCVTDAACASSFSAISMGMNELWLGQSDLVISGGADTMNDIFMYMCFSKTPALSKSGECAPFSDRSDGTLLGEGLGMVALKRLPDAERDGDHIYAVIRGLGSSSDGRAKSVYAPVPTGQAKALRRAYEAAGYSPATVELVEAHGTGTKAGDMAEFEGLQIAFDESGRSDRQWCALGTVKSQIGHTKAAAGAAGLFKIVMALHHKVLPPTIKVETPNPKLGIDRSPFYLNTKSRPWVRGKDHKRRASVSSFGFGGSNFHLALEEYDGPADHPPRLRTLPTELITLSAESPAALVLAANAIAEQSTLPGYLRYAARTSQRSFDPTAPAKLAVVASDERDLVGKLRSLAERIERAPSESLVLPTGAFYATGMKPQGTAFLFPGQGSQYVGMGADLAMESDRARSAWDHAADLTFATAGLATKGAASLPLHDVVFPHPGFTPEEDKRHEDRLRATEWAQPAIGAVSLSHLAVLDALGLHPDVVCGHSYGEITALHAAGVLSAVDMLRVARQRGERMAAAAAGEGAMTAVPRPIDEVRPHVEAVDGCTIANHNAPAQVVVSGPTAAIAALEQRLLASGIEAKRLTVATAFHSPVVSGSVEPFAAFLQGISFAPPRLPVYHNPDAAPYPADPAEIRSRLASAIAKPVRFVEQIEVMWSSGVRTFVEVGPHAVLTGLVSEILEGRPHVAVNLDRRKKHGVTALQLALARLCTAGHALNLGALWEGYADPEDPHTRPVPKLMLRIDGANYNKPYPPQGGAKALPKHNLTRTGFAKQLEAQPVDRIVEKIVERVVEVPVAAVSAVAQTTVAQSAAAQLVPSRPSSVTVHPPAPERFGDTMPTDPWIAAFQEAQRATVDAHSAYQRAMADSHEQFLKTLEQSFVGLARLAGAESPVQSTVQAPSQISMRQHQGMAPMTSGHSSTMAPPAMSPVWTPAQTATNVGSLVQNGVDVVRTAPKPTPPRPAPAVQTAPAVDVERLLLDVVAEKTGYPADMLAPHMALESDLGVDSIKRVEILSAVRERAPGLPEVDAAEMARLQTLGQVIDHLRAQLPDSSSAAPAPAVRAVAPHIAPAAPAVDVERLLLDVVAEKTGYPADMLAPHMALESDLGVDSIKRVEILSTVRERAPGLPEVDAAEMARLQTLGQVIDHLRAQLPASAPASSAQAVHVSSAAPAPSAAPAVDVERLLLDVVAEKTGYPADMLAPHMALESDLGVDSIKRVEILSAVRERAPGLPEVDAAEMARLQTLGQVIDHLRAQLPAPSPPASHSAASAPSASPAPVIDVERLLLDVVAEKTGYPADMLAPHMALESDLGVDSIKRVEILSAVRERAPGLPEVDAAEMARLQTLGQVIDHLRASLPKDNVPVTVAVAKLSSSADALQVEQGSLLGRWSLALVPARPSGFSSPGLSPNATIAVCPPGPIASALVRALQAQGLSAREAVADAAADVLVLLHGLEEGDPDAALKAAFVAARTSAAHLSSREGLLIAVQDTGGDFGLSGSSRAEYGGLAGLAKTAAQEWMSACKVIDIARNGRSTADIAAAIAAEMCSGGVEIEVGLCADGTRQVPVSVPVAVSAGVSVIDRDTTIVATGGARGVTAACLIALAKARGGHYALLGRTPLTAEPAFVRGITDDAGLKRALISHYQQSGAGIPAPAELGREVARILGNREIQATLFALEQAGAQAMYVSVDVNSPQSVSAALEAVRRSFGPIGALIHGAGVLADKLIAEKTDEAFDRVYQTKVSGLRALLAATKADPIRAILLFSSVAGRCGNRGQVDYAMANEVLAKVAAAEAARRPGAIVRALQWGPWEGGMVTKELKARFDSLGVPLIPLPVGANFLVAELADHSGATEVVLGGEPRMGPLASASGERCVKMRARVDAASFPYLADHRVAGTVVVPVVIALEWFARAAALCRPDLALVSIRDVKVLRPMKLEHFDSQGDWFDVIAQEVSNGAGAVLSLQLKRADVGAKGAGDEHVGSQETQLKRADVGARGVDDEHVGSQEAQLKRADVGAKGGDEHVGSSETQLKRADVVHYSAQAEMAQTAARSPSPPVPRTLQPWSGAPIYDGRVLFHGGSFQVIRTLEGMDDRGIDATLTSTADAGWGDEPWRTDPAALDGGLQLALLWSDRMLGGASLPMGLSSMRTFRTGSTSGPVRAVLTGERRGSSKTVTDIVFVDAAGEVTNELRGIEAILRPDR